MRGVSILFFAINVLAGVRGLCYQIIRGAGRFRATQKYAIMEMLVNILVSLLLVFRYGIYGVLIGTIIALLVGFVGYARYIEIDILEKINKNRFWYELLSYLLLCVVIILVDCRLTITVTSYFQLIVAAILCSVAIIALIFPFAWGWSGRGRVFGWLKKRRDIN